MASTFPEGTINQSCNASGDAFPTKTDSAHWWFVSMRYDVGAVAPVAIGPTSLTVVNGVWSGAVTVLQTAAGMYLRADDGAGHVATSNAFDVVVPPLDFGDAPPVYPTLWADDGARHVTASGLWLGSAVDSETDGQPSADATADDATGMPDDEDGIAFAAPFYLGTNVTVSVTASAAGKLDAWVDWNDDGDWADAGEKVFDSVGLAAGENTLTIAVPTDAALTDQTFARFRLSSTGGLSYTGVAADGEVEDYAVSVTLAPPALDFEPPVTAGTENTISWTPVPGADAYYAECDDDADFSSPEFNSGWISATSYTFAGLDGATTYYYRVKAGIVIGVIENSWTHTTQSEFNSDTLNDTSAASRPGDVVLLPQTAVVFVEDFEDGNDDGWTVYGDTFTCEVTDATAGGGTHSLMLEYTDYGFAFVMHDMDNITPNRIDFSVCTKGCNILGGSLNLGDSDAMVDENLVVQFELDNNDMMGLHYGGGSACMPYVEDRWYHVSLQLDWTMRTVDFSVDGTLVAADIPFVSTTPDGLSWICMAGYNSRGRMWWDEISMEAEIGYVSLGSITSMPIAPSPWQHWNALEYNATVLAGTTLTVDVLPATSETPIPGYENLASGADLSGLGETTIRLRANLATTDPAVTPALHDWTVTWQEATVYEEGPWSNVVCSTQDAAPPTVEGVFVKGTTWDSAFLNSLDSQGSGLASVPGLGYAVPDGAAQLNTLPWSNIDTISVAFSEDVVVGQGDLAISGVNVPAYTITGFNYDAIAHTATWTLAAPINTDRLAITLVDSVHDALGHALDGQWHDGTSAFPSGDGTAGGSFRFAVNVLPGDANHDGVVNAVDAALVMANWGVSGAVLIPGDFTGDGRVDANDEAILGSRWGARLPAPAEEGSPEALGVSATPLVPKEVPTVGEPMIGPRRVDASRLARQPIELAGRIDLADYAVPTTNADTDDTMVCRSTTDAALDDALLAGLPIGAAIADAPAAHDAALIGEYGPLVGHMIVQRQPIARLLTLARRQAQQKNKMLEPASLAVDLLLADRWV